MNNMPPITSIQTTSSVAASVPQRPMPASPDTSLGGPAAEEVFSARPISYPEPETGVSQRIDTSQHHEEQFDREEAKAYGDRALRLVTKEGPTKAMERLADGDMDEFDESFDEELEAPVPFKRIAIESDKIEDPLGILSQKDMKPQTEKELMVAKMQHEIDKLQEGHEALVKEFDFIKGRLEQSMELNKQMAEILLFVLKEKQKEAKDEDEKSFIDQMVQFTILIMRSLYGDEKAIEELGKQRLIQPQKPQQKKAA